MQSSKTLLEFYKAWLNDGEGGWKPSRKVGLCHNLCLYIRYFEPDTNTAITRRELTNQFKTAELDIETPFNESFGEYHEEGCNNQCHLNPLRVQWVKDRINDMEGV